MAAGAAVSSIIGPVELVGVLGSIRLVSVGQVTLMVEHWVAAGAAVSVWPMAWAWVGLATAEVAVMADSGSAGTILFKFCKLFVFNSRMKPRRSSIEVDLHAEIRILRDKINYLEHECQVNSRSCKLFYTIVCGYVLLKTVTWLLNGK